MNLTLKLIVITGLYGLVFIGLEMLAAKYKPDAELARKLAHILAGVGAVLLPAFLTYPEIALMGVILVIGMTISMRRQIFTVVHGVIRNTYGEIYFPLSITLCALIFPNLLFYTYAMLVLGISDAMASLVGQRFGRHKLSLLGSVKSYEGSGAFFVVTTLIGMLLLLTLTPVSLLWASLISIGSAAVLTVAEAIGGKGLDDLFVPLAACSLFWVAQNIGLLG